MLDEDKWLVKKMESSAKQQIELIHLMCGNYACDLSTATQVGQGLSNTECMKLGWLYAWMLWCGARIRSNQNLFLIYLKHLKIMRWESYSLQHYAFPRGRETEP